MSTFRNVRLSNFEQPRFGQLHNAKSTRHVATSADVPEVAPVRPTNQPGSKAKRSSLLTTESYSVSMLVANPVILGKLNGERADAQIDSAAGYALVNTDGGSYVWPYTSSEAAPFSLAFGQNIDQETTAALVDPSGGAAEPGIVLVGKETGAITLWESVGRSVADGLFIQGNSLEHVLALQRREKIEKVTYISNVGLICITSAGRFFLVSLRNAQHKPEITVARMRSLRGGILAIKESFLSASYYWDVTAVFGGAQVNESERAVFVCTRKGKMTVWHCGFAGTSRLVAEVQLLDSLYKGLCLLYPTANLSLAVHDAQVYNDQLLVLASFRNDDEVFWILGFADLDGAYSVNFRSLHRLQSYVSAEQHTARLAVTDRMVYAELDRAVVILERDPPAHQPRFEDVLYMQSGVSLFGIGSSPAGLEVITSAGVLELRMNAKLVLSSAVSRIQVAVMQANSSLPLDLQPHTSLGTLDEIRDAARAAVSSINNTVSHDAQKTLANRFNALKLLVNVIDRAPFPKGSDVPVDTDTRWWIAEEIALVAAAETVCAATASAEPVKDVGGTPAVLISLLSASPALGFTAVSNAQTALTDAGTPEQFPHKCPWLASREIVGALESAAHKLEQLSASAVEALCGAYSLRLRYLQASGNVQEYEKLQRQADQHQDRLLHDLARVDIRGAVDVAEKFSLLKPLAALLAVSWEELEYSAQSDVVTRHMSEFGYEFAESLFTELLKAQGPRKVFQEFLDSYPEYLDRYVDEKHLYRQSWVLAYFQDDISRAARVLEQAAKPKPGRPLPASERVVIASLQKLCAVQAGERSIFDSAERELKLAGAQKSLQSQHAQVGEFLTSDRPGVNELLAQLLLKLEANELSVDETVDLLTFVPLKAPASFPNYAHGFALTDSRARCCLLAQQTIINTNWAVITDSQSLSDSLLSQTLKGAPASAQNYLLNPATWTAPSTIEEVRALYPEISLSADKLLADFETFNAQVEAICKQFDLMQWLRLLS